ncbi:MAG: LysR family transcriptional regulator [Clostridiales bacterium]|nr:LysR family transcriptional regulator [Clostridiales bacterium]
MNLKQLEYFLVAVEMKNITAASKKLHVAQPPLSRQISLLEQEMGITLLKRSNKGIETTEAGRMLYLKAKEILGAIEEMTEMVRETDAGVRGELRIGAIYSALPVFGDKLKYISQHYPLIRMQVMHGDPNELMEFLEKGIVDVLILRSPTCETKDFSYKILEEEDLVLVLHRDLDPAPEQPELEIEQLRGLPLCMLRSGNYWGYNEFLVDECKKHGFTPDILCECHDTSVALVLVMQKLGISYQPRSIVEMLSLPGIYIKPLKNFETKTYPTLIWDENEYLPRCVRIFLELFNVNSEQELIYNHMAKGLSI